MVVRGLPLEDVGAGPAIIARSGRPMTLAATSGQASIWLP